MDLFLSQMNGLETSEKILEYLKQKVDIKTLPYICLLTGANTKQLKQVSKFGIKKIVKKPIFKQGV